MKKNEDTQEIEVTDGELSAVFSDLMSFFAGLFILLFTIVNSQKNSPQYFAEMSLKLGGVEQNKKMNSEDLFVSDVRNFIRDEQISQYALVLVDEQKIRLIFNDPILFESGTNILTKDSKAVLVGLVNIIKNIKNPIIIEGHTDDLPVKPGGKYRSNWDLAYYRAFAVADYFMKQGVKEGQISISSFGDQRPLTEKKTMLARKKNRRIEINIIRVKEKT